MVHAFVFQHQVARWLCLGWSCQSAFLARSCGRTTSLRTVRRTVHRCQLLALLWAGRGSGGYWLRNRVRNWRKSWHVNGWVRIRNYCRSDGCCRTRGFASSRGAALNSSWAGWAAGRRKAGVWAPHGFAAGEARWECHSCKRRREIENKKRYLIRIDE